MLSINRKDALVISFLTGVACWLSAYLTSSQTVALPMATFLIAYSTRKITLRRSVVFFLCLLFSAMLTILLYEKTNTYLSVFYTLFIVFSLSYLLAIAKRPLISYELMSYAIFSLSLSAFSIGYLQAPIRSVLIDIMLGAVLGFLGSVWLLPIKINTRFRTDLTPQLIVLKDAITSFTNPAFYQSNQMPPSLLQYKPNAYPEWVFEPGFNPAFRSGLRFFLLQLEHAIELCLASHFLLTRINPDVLNEVRGQLIAVMQKNLVLIDMLLQYMSQQQVDMTSEDFKTDLEVFASNYEYPNQSLQSLTAQQVLLLDLVRDLKDLRQTLLTLTTSIIGSIDNRREPLP